MKQYLNTDSSLFIYSNSDILQLDFRVIYHILVGTFCTKRTMSVAIQYSLQKSSHKDDTLSALALIHHNNGFAIGSNKMRNRLPDL